MRVSSNSPLLPANPSRTKPFVTRLLLAFAKALLFAGSLACLSWCPIGYGVLGPPPVARAVLETTSQSPMDVLPQPSPGAVPGGRGSAEVPTAVSAASAPGASVASALGALVAVVLVAGVLVVVNRTRRRI